MSHELAELQAVEGEVARQLLDEVGPHCMIDVGAHHGTSLEPFLFAGWQVVAFEPIASNRSACIGPCASLASCSAGETLRGANTPLVGSRGTPMFAPGGEQKTKAQQRKEKYAKREIH